MPDERVAAAIRNWAGRFIAKGIDYNDFVATTGAIETWAQWLPAWTAVAEAQRAAYREADRPAIVCSRLDAAPFLLPRKARPR